MIKNIKILSAALLMVLASGNISAQNNKGKIEDLGRVVLNAYVSPQVEGLPASAKKMLHNKLAQITAKNGVGGSSFAPQFILTPNITVLTKDLTATAPPMTAMTLEFTLYIGDGYEGTVFSTTSIEVKGVGTNETKAYISAIKRLKPGHPDIKAFIEEGKTKIIEYYNTKCDFIIKEAQTLAAQNKFDEAIFRLTTVPDVCKACYDKCMDAVAPMYQQKIDRECEIKYTTAQAYWNAAQDMQAAENAGAILSSIEPEAACFSKVAGLMRKIETKVKEIDKREWKYTLKNQAQESERIEAYRAVGVAYGKNQPQNVTYKSLW